MASEARPIGPLLPPWVAVWRWARLHLFSSFANTVLTIVTLAIVGYAAYQVTQFVFASAEWNTIEANRGLYFTGPVPRDALWRLG